MVLLLIGCSNADSRKAKEDIDPEFTVNAGVDDIGKSLQYVTSEYDFSVIFFERDDSNSGWYKMISRQGDRWEKIEIRETIMDEEQARRDPGYYISRDITARKLCHSEESKFFMDKLKALGVFELPEEKVFFKNCRDSQITDLGYIYIIIVSGNKVRKLRYSGVYECSNGECDRIYKIQELFEKEWFENAKGR